MADHPSAPVSPAPASSPPCPPPSAHKPSTPPSPYLEPPARACDAEHHTPAATRVTVSPPAPDAHMEDPVRPSPSALLSPPERSAPFTPTRASPSTAPQPSPSTYLPLSVAPAHDAEPLETAASSPPPARDADTIAAAVAASLAVSHPGDARDADHLSAAVSASIAYEASARAAEDAAFARAVALSRAGDCDEDLRRATAASIDAMKRSDGDDDLRRAVNASIEEARRAERASLAARIEEDVFGGMDVEDGKGLGEEEMLRIALANSVRERKISVEEMQEVAIREWNLDYARRLRMEDEEMGERGVGDVDGSKREEGASAEGEVGMSAKGAGHGDVTTVGEATVAASASVATAVGEAAPHTPSVTAERAVSLVCLEAAEVFQANELPTLAGKVVTVATVEETDTRESDAAAADDPEILRALALSATEKKLSVQDQQAVLLEECRRVDVLKLSRESSDCHSRALDSLLSSATAVEPDLAKALEASGQRGTLTVQEQQAALLAEYLKSDEMLLRPGYVASEGANAASSRLESAPSAKVTLPSAAGSGHFSQIMMDTDPALRHRSAKHLSIKPGESVDGNWLRGKRPNRRIVIDGQNVACNEGGRTKFSMKALKSAIDFFVTRGDDVIAIVPSARLDTRPHNKHMVADNVELLQQLKREEKVVYSPSGVGAHDDHFIIQVALQYRSQGDNVAIVSNDHFREMGRLQNSAIAGRKVDAFIRECRLPFMFLESAFIPAWARSNLRA